MRSADHELGTGHARVESTWLPAPPRVESSPAQPCTPAPSRTGHGPSTAAASPRPAAGRKAAVSHRREDTAHGATPQKHGHRKEAPGSGFGLRKATLGLSMPTDPGACLFFVFYFVFLGTSLYCTFQK